MLPAEITQAVKRIQFVTGRQVADVMAGAYLSVFKGRGMEFDEVRPYIPGDDVRTIDWNVTARTGEPYIKRFVEERELTVMLLVDVSGSQEFGSGRRSKLEAAVELSALLALSASANDDKVGLLLFHGSADLYIPPRKGGKQRCASSARCSRAAQGVAPAERMGWLRTLPAAARRLWQRLRRQRTATTATARHQHRRRPRAVPAGVAAQDRAVPDLDFLDDGYLEILRHAGRKHDVVAALLTDRREAEMPPAGLVTLQDAETGAETLVDTRSARFRAELTAAAAARRDRLAHELRASRIDLLELDASEPVVDPLLRFFHERQRRQRR
ncbi:MAG: DUF58 domain-containing protein [Kofleriaceae bacterium]